MPGSAEKRIESLRALRPAASGFRKAGFKHGSRENNSWPPAGVKAGVRLSVNNTAGIIAHQFTIGVNRLLSYLARYFIMSSLSKSPKLNNGRACNFSV